MKVLIVHIVVPNKSDKEEKDYVGQLENSINNTKSVMTVRPRPWHIG